MRLQRFVILAIVIMSGFVLHLLPSPFNAQETLPPPSVYEGHDGTLRRLYVPVLMYHYVSPLPADADDIRVNLTVTPELFDAHMAYLSANGYQTVSLYEIHAALLTGAPLPMRPVVLTFDDGYRDHYTHVFPILRRYGFTGTFFVISGFVDAANPNHLTWDQVREMADAGMSMEAHTKNHRDLRNRDYPFLIYEILGSLESLRAHTGRETRMFSYPVGRYDERVLDVMDDTQVLRAVTTQHGAWHTLDNALEMPRLRVHHNTGVAGLAQLLESGR